MKVITTEEEELRFQEKLMQEKPNNIKDLGVYITKSIDEYAAGEECFEGLDKILFNVKRTMVRRYGEENGGLAKLYYYGTLKKLDEFSNNTEYLDKDDIIAALEQLESKINAEEEYIEELVKDIGYSDDIFLLGNYLKDTLDYSSDKLEENAEKIMKRVRKVMGRFLELPENDPFIGRHEKYVLDLEDAYFYGDYQTAFPEAIRNLIDDLGYQ